MRKRYPYTRCFSLRFETASPLADCQKNDGVLPVGRLLVTIGSDCVAACHPHPLTRHQTGLVDVLHIDLLACALTFLMWCQLSLTHLHKRHRRDPVPAF